MPPAETNLHSFLVRGLLMSGKSDVNALPTEPMVLIMGMVTYTIFSLMFGTFPPSGWHDAVLVQGPWA